MSRRDAPYLLRDIVSTITSPVFSEVILVFQFADLYRPYRVPFDMIREMHSKKKFRLVYCLEVSKKYRDEILQTMRQRMEWEIAHGRLDFLESPPTLTISERDSWADI
jgi:hypothetical protein